MCLHCQWNSCMQLFFLSWVTEQIIGHLLIISLPRHLSLHSFYFFSKMQKTDVCVCVSVSGCVWIAPCHACECDTGRVAGGLRGGQAQSWAGSLCSRRAKRRSQTRKRGEASVFPIPISPPLSFHRLLPSPSAFLSLSLCILLALASVTAASPLGSGMLPSASLVWAIAAVGSISSLCAVWTER